MYKVSTTFFIVLLAGLTVAQAAEKKLQLYLGPAKPLSHEFAEQRLSGLLVGAGLALPVSRRYELVGVVQYGRFPVNRNKIFSSLGIAPETSLLTAADAELFGLFIKNVIRFPAKKSQKIVSYYYLAPGVQFRFAEDIKIGTEEEDIIIQNENACQLGIATGIGVIVEMEKMHFFVETGIDLCIQASNTISYLPIKVGILVSF